MNVLDDSNLITLTHTLHADVCRLTQRMTCLHHSYLMRTKRCWIVITWVDAAMWLRSKNMRFGEICVSVCARVCEWMCLLAWESQCVRMCRCYPYLALIPRLLIVTRCRRALRNLFVFVTVVPHCPPVWRDVWMIGARLITACACVACVRVI